MFAIELTSPAFRVYRRLDKRDKEIVDQAFGEISANPISHPLRKIKKLVSVDKYRYRAEYHWRIIYSINSTERTVYIEAISKRREDTYRHMQT